MATTASASPFTFICVSVSLIHISRSLSQYTHIHSSHDYVVSQPDYVVSQPASFLLPLNCPKLACSTPRNSTNEPAGAKETEAEGCYGMQILTPAKPNALELFVVLPIQAHPTTPFRATAPPAHAAAPRLAQPEDEARGSRDAAAQSHHPRMPTPFLICDPLHPRLQEIT